MRKTGARLEPGKGNEKDKKPALLGATLRKGVTIWIGESLGDALLMNVRSRKGPD